MSSVREAIINSLSSTVDEMGGSLTHELTVGAVITGKVHIGDGVNIGPNSVVLTDVPASATVLAPMAKIIRPVANNGTLEKEALWPLRNNNYVH